MIYVELVEAEEKTRIDYMIDQAHNIEPRIEAMILSVMNLQDAYAKALLVDRAKLDGARRSGDVLRRTGFCSKPTTPTCGPCARRSGKTSALRRIPSPPSGERLPEKVVDERLEGAGAGWG